MWALKKFIFWVFLDVVSCRYQVSPNCSIVLFTIFVALLIFCPEELFIDVSRVLKSPTSFVFPSVFPFMSLRIVLCFRSSYIGCIYVKECNIFFLYQYLYYYIMPLLIPARIPRDWGKHACILSNKNQSGKMWVLMAKPNRFFFYNNKGWKATNTYWVPTIRH